MFVSVVERKAEREAEKKLPFYIHANANKYCVETVFSFEMSAENIKNEHKVSVIMTPA